jgi:Fe-S-cluster containining protein
MPLATRTRCTGHCCRMIRIGEGVSRETVLQMAFDPRATEEHAKIAAMLRPLVGEPPVNLHRDEAPLVWLTEADHYYTCIHFDGRNCTAYEARPRMCSAYPYGNTCEVEGCTWDPDEARLVSHVIDRGRAHEPRPHVEELVQIALGPRALERRIGVALTQEPPCEPAA